MNFLDLTNFITLNATDMGFMFSGCHKLKEIKGINSFDTSHVINMDSMFKECNLLEYLDLSNFNTYNVVDMENMFKQCNKLKEIKGIKNFKLFEDTKKSDMFSGCHSLKALDLSYFNISNTNNKKERPIEIIFKSVDQEINYKTYCYKTDSFSKIEKEIYNKFPELKLKQDVYFFCSGSVINSSATLEENKIKNNMVILINY